MLVGKRSVDVWPVRFFLRFEASFQRDEIAVECHPSLQGELLFDVTLKLPKLKPPWKGGQMTADQASSHEVAAAENPNAFNASAMFGDSASPTSIFSSSLLEVGERGDITTLVADAAKVRARRRHGCSGRMQRR